MFSHSTFEEEQRLRKQEIVGRILKEAAKEEGRKRKQSSPAKARGRPTLREKTWNYVTDVCEERDTALPSCHLLVSREPLPVKRAHLQGSGQMTRGPGPWSHCINPSS